MLQRRSPSTGDTEAIDRLMALDRLAAAVAAATHTEIVRFADLALARQRGEGVPPRRLGEGIADQVALALRISPVTAARQMNRARLLTRELPCIFRLLATGQVSDWVATIVAAETRELNAADKATLDQDLASNLPGFGPREAEAAARRIAYRLDPHGVLRRSRAARVDRRVSIRPAPDTMALLSGLLPVEQGVAAWAAMDRDAKALKADGDLRSLSQLRADLMVQRLTGAESPTQLPVQISIVMPSGSLLDANDATPARLDGSGPIPADLARRLATNPDAAVFIRRLFTDPVDATVTNADWRRRRFTSSARRLIAARDQTCARRTAVRRSGTSTTSSLGATRGPPPSSTAKDSASATTTPKSEKAGESRSWLLRPTPRRPPPLPATSTGPELPRPWDRDLGEDLGPQRLG
ncbi:MAG: DUF222 domain-containing protein [Nocardioidaceae bacterium]